MEKVVYLLWAQEREDLDAHAEKLLDVCERLLLPLGAHGMTLFVADFESRVPSPSKGFTGRRPFTAMLSLWLGSASERRHYEPVLREHTEKQAGYLVTESLYTDWGENVHGKPRDWPDGERSPGVFAVTLLERPDGHDEEAWFTHWYGTQSPVSEAMQPRARYVRNAVARVLSPDAPPYAGIVEEAWPSAKHVSDPYLFYGAKSLEELAQNMSAMLDSVSGFLDLSRIQTVMLSEYVLRTPAWLERRKA
jgi:hypothetical protein